MYPLNCVVVSVQQKTLSSMAAPSPLIRKRGSGGYLPSYAPFAV